MYILCELFVVCLSVCILLPASTNHLPIFLKSVITLPSSFSVFLLNCTVFQAFLVGRRSVLNLGNPDIQRICMASASSNLPLHKYIIISAHIYHSRKNRSSRWSFAHVTTQLEQLCHPLATAHPYSPSPAERRLSSLTTQSSTTSTSESIHDIIYHAY